MQLDKRFLTRLEIRRKLSKKIECLWRKDIKFMPIYRTFAIQIRDDTERQSGITLI